MSNGVDYSWAELKADLFGARASVQPLAGWLLAGLIFYVVWLTLEYGPIFECKRAADEAAKRGAPSPSCLAEVPGNVITDRMAWTTFIIVIVVALLAAIEPSLQRLFSKVTDRIRRRMALWPKWMGGVVGTAVASLLFVWRASGVVLSGLDTLLARLVARAA